MPYATLQDLKDAAPNLRIGAGSKPSDQQVQELLDQTNAEVDGVLTGLGYIIPVTGTESVAILKEIVILGALARTLKAMFYGVRNPDEVGANDAWNEFKAKLKALADPEDPMTLPDAQVADQAGKDTTPVSSDVASYIDLYGDDSRPTRDQVF